MFISGTQSLRKIIMPEYNYVTGFDKEDDYTFQVKVLKQDFVNCPHYDEIDPEIREDMKDDWYIRMEELSDVYTVMHILEWCDIKLSGADWKYTTNLIIMLQ